MSARESPLAMLRELGSIPDLWTAAGGLTTGSRLKVNSHVHVPPNFSAFTSLAEVVERAAAENVRVLGTSNYYDWSMYAPFARLAQAKGIFPLFGLEVICMVDELRQAGVRLNDPGNPGKFYLCAKGLTRFEPMDARAERLITVIRRQDGRRMAAMIDRLHMVFASHGVPVQVDETSVMAMVRDRYGLPASAPIYLQERHVALAFQAALFSSVPVEQRAAALSCLCGPACSAWPEDAIAVQEALRAHLMKAGKPGFVPETYVDFAHVYDLVLALGGIPCYTIVADGMQPISEYERSVDQLIAAIQKRGIYCAELIPNRNTPETVERYTRALRAAGIIVLAGTEHNTLGMVPMEPTCFGGTPIADHLKDVFWEGACVVAAHQFLAAHGLPGYVDAKGHPNAAYGSADARIDALAALGAAVIDVFCRAEPRHSPGHLSAILDATG
jgi:hypothetical protein